MNDKKIKKIVLAYSGGLDTTVILHWLKNKYDADVITFTADIGQEQNEDLVRERANSIGASKVIIEDLRERFTKDFIFPMFKANAVYEGEYLLGTSIARPLIAKRLVEIAKMIEGNTKTPNFQGKCSRTNGKINNKQAATLRIQIVFRAFSSPLTFA